MMLRKLVPAVLLLLAACRNQDEAGAEALWDEVHAAEYRTWERAPGWPERMPSGSAHGNFVDIYVNEVIVEALASESLTAWPDGSIIVKDGWTDESPRLVAIMEKQGDEWFFAEYEPDGKVDYSGQPRTCTKCHNGGADAVLAFGFP